MRKKIAISQVRMGMFVDCIDGPWLKHSLWKTRFLIKDDETLARVRTCGAAECWIDVAEGADVAPSTPIVQPRASVTPIPAAKRIVRTSMADELQNASKVLQHSKAALTTLFEEARMGRAVEWGGLRPRGNKKIE